jgi:prevent-host-death family protein
MHTVNIHEAKTQLSKLIEKAVNGESFIIAKAGKPLVKVTRLEPASKSSSSRLGFLAGQIKVPTDFDTMGAAEIEQMFAGLPKATKKS